jgi:uncharacterized RDD family membrane protein YckC
LSPPAPAAPAGPARHRSYAGLISRLTALALDVVLLCAATIGVRLLPGTAWTQIVNRSSPGWLEAAAVTMASLLPWLYFTVSWWLSGQTVGDMLIGVSVRHDDGRALSLLRSAVRAAVGLLLAPLWIVGLFCVLWDRRRRALHDLIFGTVVPYTTRTRSGARPKRRRKVW